MRLSLRSFTTILIALGCGLLASNLIKHGTLKRVDQAVLVAEAESESILTLNFGYRTPDDGVFHRTGAVRQLIFPGAVRTVRFQNYDNLGGYLQLEVGKPTTLLIHSLELHNRFSNEPLVLSGQLLAERLAAASPKSQVSLSGDRVSLTTFGPNAKATLYTSLQRSNPLLRYGIALLTALIVWIVLQFGRPGSIAAIRDIYQPAGSRYLVELDGLRGVAALLVLLEHSWAPFAGAGATGVWIFFVLSGYLLSQPFVADPARAVSLNYVCGYLTRRLGRILPMYFMLVLVIFGLNNNSPLLIDHLLFIQARGHLWTIPHELVFYLFLPVFMLCGYFAWRLSARLFLPAMIILCALFLWRPDLALIQLHGNGNLRPPYIGWFLLGVVLAAAAPWIESTRRRLTSSTSRLIGIVGATLMGLLISASCYGLTATLVMQNVTLPVNFPRIFGVAAALLLFLVILAPRATLGRILAWVPLRAVGIVGYSFYLLHPFVIKLIVDMGEKFWGVSPHGPLLFLVSGLLTWLISLLTYSQVERPFLSRAKPRS